MNHSLRTVLCFGMGAVFSASAVAHELKPALLEIHERDSTHFEIIWKTAAADRLDSARPVFPPDSIQISKTQSRLAGSNIERYEISRVGGLGGQPLGIGGAVASLLDVLVRYVPLTGPPQIERITPDRPMVYIAAQRNAWSQAGTFFRLGLEHILLGVDHLLFVLGLVLLVRNRWMLLKTITAFTVAHSITLAVATLGGFRIPTLPLNAAIALSILFLGPEIMRVHRVKLVSLFNARGSSPLRLDFSTDLGLRVV